MNKFLLLIWIDYKYLLFDDEMNIIRNRKKKNTFFKNRIRSDMP